jgi:hypothetical protein
VTDRASDVAVSSRPRPAVDVRWQHTARRLAGVSAVVLIVVFGFVGGVKALFFNSTKTASPDLAIHGPTIEARMLDLATSCIRDANNYDEQQHAADVAAGSDPYRDRLAHCFALTPGLLDQVWDGHGTQQAAEPLAAITRRTADGLTATVVVRMRVSGNPLPVFRYFSVDVGCRPDGQCSLTTVPTEVKNLDGAPLDAPTTTTPAVPPTTAVPNPATSKP